jgi:hypothetical protein
MMFHFKFRIKLVTYLFWNYINLKKNGVLGPHSFAQVESTTKNFMTLFLIDQRISASAMSYPKCFY